MRPQTMLAGVKVQLDEIQRRIMLENTSSGTCMQPPFKFQCVGVCV